MSASQANGAAHTAGVMTEGGSPDRTAAQQAYLDAVADDAAHAVDNVQNMIDDLTASLPDRKAEAERAQAEADNGRV